MSDEDDVIAQALRDAEHTAPNIKDAKLKHISELANKQLDLLRKVAKAEEELKQFKEDLKVVSEEELPAAMTDAGVRHFTLEDGSSITVEPYFSVNLPTMENRPTAWRWLIDNDYGAILKTQVRIEYGKGDEERQNAIRFAEELKAQGYNATMTEDTHVMTLKALIVSEYKKGVNFPTELFPFWHGERAEVVTKAEVKEARLRRSYGGK